MFVKKLKHNTTKNLKYKFMATITIIVIKSTNINLHFFIYNMFLIYIIF